MADSGVTETNTRVRYAETDQMGYAHHSHYLVWCELGRTQHMRKLGSSYRDLEAEGVRLPVVAANLRFRRPARYDDSIRIRSWVRRCTSRLVEFGNAIERDSDLLATATITLMPIRADGKATTLPSEVRERLVPAPDPVRM